MHRRQWAAAVVWKPFIVVVVAYSVDLDKAKLLVVGSNGWTPEDAELKVYYVAQNTGDDGVCCGEVVLFTMCYSVPVLLPNIPESCLGV